jgi:hypothetical protein
MPKIRPRTGATIAYRAMTSTPTGGRTEGPVRHGALGSAAVDGRQSVILSPCELVPALDSRSVGAQPLEGNGRP